MNYPQGKSRQEVDKFYLKIEKKREMKFRVSGVQPNKDMKIIFFTTNPQFKVLNIFPCLKDII